MENRLVERITIDPDICHGKPCIRGMRYPVGMMLELLSSGMEQDEILLYVFLPKPWNHKPLGSLNSFSVSL